MSSNVQVETNSKIRLADFIIAGAMKCGTTSLHYILGQHPDIFMARGEIHYYDADEIWQHPDFFVFNRDSWSYPRLVDQPQKYLSWYASFFSEADEHQLAGEDSTTYIASEKAAERIAADNPQAKIIVMLRDPASRTYSHYWHLVRTGRALWDFEESIQLDSWGLIQRSLYKGQIERLLKFFPVEQTHFILFEEFVRDMPGTVSGVCDFLGVSPSGINLSAIDTHRNRTLVPRSFRLQLWRNRLLKGRARQRYVHHLPEFSGTQKKDPFMDTVHLLHRRVNPLRPVSPPPMKPGTRQFLNRFFSRENAGLDAMIGSDVASVWYRG